ncbi:MAG: hypothetical protein ACE5HS_16185 [bacterium]
MNENDPIFPMASWPKVNACLARRARLREGVFVSRIFPVFVQTLFDFNSQFFKIHPTQEIKIADIVEVIIYEIMQIGFRVDK